MTRLGPADIDGDLYSQFRQEITRKYGGKKGDLQKALEQAIKYFLVLSPVRIVLTKDEAKLFESVLMSEWFRRDIGMATKDEIANKSKLEATIAKNLEMVRLLKDLGVLHVEG